MSLQPVPEATDEGSVGGGFMTYWASSVVYVALLPIFVVAHELGHAAVCLARTEASVVVGIGRPPGRWRVRLGRLDVTMGLNFWSRRKPSGTVSHGGLDRWSAVACGLAGPVAQAAASALLLPIGIAMHRPLVGDAGVLGIGLSLSALVPFRYHGYRSDGANLVRAARLRPDPLIEMRRRWLVLLKDVKGTLGPTRGHVLNGLPPALGHPGKGPDALAVWTTAFAGFCWRAVDTGAQEMRGAALDALHREARAGESEPQLTFGAAWSLIERESETAIEQLSLMVESPEIDEQTRRTAFRFGLALYDVESARGSVA